MRCILHKWGSWRPININVYSDAGPLLYTLSGQRRDCLRCNKRKVREV